MTIMLAGRGATDLTVTISWGTPADNGEPITGYTVEATGGFNGGSRRATTTGTSTQLSFPCAGSTFCANGRLDVSVTATNRAGTGPAGNATWNVPLAPPPAPTTTTNPPPPPPPPPTTTTTTPPPPPPPPPATVPTEGAVVISSISNVDPFTRRLNLAPPADWANHDGTCTAINTTVGDDVPISCSASSVEMSVDVGINRFVIRATARDGSRSVVSAARSVSVRDPEPTCGKYACLRANNVVELSPTQKSIQYGPAGAGLGLLALAFLLRVRRRDTDGGQR
ncbi:fibronectin type III domain-containing protein [Actinophytocola sp.]|uniref:fibronectin type III domain-containing protein n=1 Tax=Actinophytocola sp. TaxID=1872138 RepID=UPI002DDCE1F7|nr:fibronectin type III domain-containing protein [Actinophytocola sp.]